MKIIQRDFLPADLLPLLQENNIDGCVRYRQTKAKMKQIFITVGTTK
jgi:L-fuconolactonase